MFEDESDGAVVATIEDAARASAAADARRFAAIAELIARRCDVDGDERDYWMCDFWSATAAEISAAMTIGHRAASREMHIAMALRHRLPRLAALYAQGRLSSRVVSTIAWRTGLVEAAAETLAAIDTDLAERAEHFTALSDDRLDQAIDQAVERHDPEALRRTRNAVRGRDVRIGKRDDATGTASLWGRLTGTDAARVDRRLAEMARQVCPADPRTMGQRRSDALGILFAGGTVLPCRCETPDCPVAGVEDARAANTVIHILARAESLDAVPDAAIHGEYDPATEAADAQGAGPEQAEVAQTRPGPAQGEAGGETDGDEANGHEANAPDTAADVKADTETGADAIDTTSGGEPAPETRTDTASQAIPPRRPQHPAAVIIGGGVLPAPLLAELLHAGAKVQPLRPPCVDPENRYRPSAALADFVRMRDMTCRYPGCNRPADRGDVDHTVPHPDGPTHPSNLQCLCRHHHLLKTFWEGFHARQHSDGTIIWTTPSGRTYTTLPGSRLLSPEWLTTTARLPETAGTATTSRDRNRGLMMPRRRRTRAQDHAQRIKAERALNERHVAPRTKPPPM